MSAFTEGKQRILNILEKCNYSYPVYYEEGVGQGYSVIGRIRKSSNERTIIEFEILDYSDNYMLKRNNFIQGYTKLVLPEPERVYTPFPLYY
jgi:hypothetical protein